MVTSYNFDRGFMLYVSNGGLDEIKRISRTHNVPILIFFMSYRYLDPLVSTDN